MVYAIGTPCKHPRPRSLRSAVDRAGEARLRNGVQPVLLQGEGDGVGWGGAAQQGGNSANCSRYIQPPRMHGRVHWRAAAGLSLSSHVVKGIGPDARHQGIHCGEHCNEGEWALLGKEVRTNLKDPLSLCGSCHGPRIDMIAHGGESFHTSKKTSSCAQGGGGPDVVHKAPPLRRSACGSALFRHCLRAGRQCKVERRVLLRRRPRQRDRMQRQCAWRSWEQRAASRVQRSHRKAQRAVRHAVCSKNKQGGGCTRLSTSTLLFTVTHLAGGWLEPVQWRGGETA